MADSLDSVIDWVLGLGPLVGWLVGCCVVVFVWESIPWVPTVRLWWVFSNALGKFVTFLVGKSSASHDGKIS